MEYSVLIEKLIKSDRYRQALDLPKKVLEEYKFLARGEYNVNLIFFHPVWEKKLILRINFSSQMKLEKQIEYEAYALALLESTKRTPKVYYVDDSKEFIDKGILVMEYLEGHSLDYEKELFRAVSILSDIHSLKIDKKNKLIKSDNSIAFILDECEAMLKVYLESSKVENSKKERLIKLLNKAKDLGKRVEDSFKGMYKCLINTELNSSNFLINDSRDYLVDWEKPIYSYPAQDLGHFLAPTTTFWKTDIILNKEQVEEFIDRYVEISKGRFDTRGVKEATYIFIKINCIRGLTWCAMAYIEYLNKEKDIMNESTVKKLEAYLSDDFIRKIELIYSKN